MHGNLSFMIQKGTYINVADNSGAKTASCIRVYTAKKLKATLGDTVLVSIKSLRSSKKSTIKVKKGELYKALIIRVRNFSRLNIINPISLKFFENSIVLLNKNNKLIGTRIFGIVPKFLRYTKFTRITGLVKKLV